LKVAALIDVESRWNPRAVSSKRRYGIDAVDAIATARRFGALQALRSQNRTSRRERAYVTTLMWEFHGDLRLVAAAYYAGDRWVGKRQFDYSNPDVIAYVESVRRHYVARKLAATGSLPRR
jgi:soluble lytic murein transglycosylase